jgi:hypothetical protein
VEPVTRQGDADRRGISRQHRVSIGSSALDLMALCRAAEAGAQDSLPGPGTKSLPHAEGSIHVLSERSRGGASMRVELNQLAGRVGPTFESRYLQRCPVLSAGTGGK